MGCIQSESDFFYEKDERVTKRNSPSGGCSALESAYSGIPSKNPSGSELKKASEKGFYEEIKRRFNFRQRRKIRAVQRQWKRLRRLNNRFKKKVCKLQTLRTDITQLQAQIIEAKQDIVNQNRE